MENLTGGTPPVRYLLCVVPCKLYFTLVETFFSKRFHKNRKNASCQFIQIFSTAKQILNFFNFWNVFIIRSTRM